LGTIEQKDIEKGKSFNAAKMTFTNYTNNAVPEYKTACPNFQKCSGAIQLKGRYLIALYASNKKSTDDSACATACPAGTSCDTATGNCTPVKKNTSLNSGGLPYCQVFTEDVPNLKAEEFIPSKVGNTIGAISITPIK
jgi:hypothetical protein